MRSPDPQGAKVLIAAAMVSMVLGSIHAFSVFLAPLEAAFGTSRATVSLIYAFSLVFLTSAVLVGPAVYARLRPATIYLWVAVLGALGAGLAGIGGTLEAAFIGYGFVFGIANGLGYGFGLQFAARANPGHAGFAMGVVTAAYAFGAVVAPFGFEIALAAGGFFAAMIALGVVVLCVSLAAAVLVASSGVGYADAGVRSGVVCVSWRRIAPIWVAYGSGVAAGLMAIGHAAGIAGIAGFSGWIAAAVIAGCNLGGSLLSGWLSDRIAHRQILTLLPLLGALALLVLSMWPMATLVLLGVVGFAYGGTIATYPAAVARAFPGDAGPQAYGRIFTAWGAAGLLAPWLAGQVYDWGGSYAPALWIAAGFGVISACVAARSIG